MSPPRPAEPGPAEPEPGPAEPSSDGPVAGGRPMEPDQPVPPPRPGEPLRRPGGSVIAAVALGGALGSAARYGLAVLWPHAPDGIPWATLLTNVSGCLLIGLLMGLIGTATAPHPLARAFLGTGMLGGFTTFSTYAVESHGLLLADRPGPAVGYLLGTLVGALAAVRLGTWAADLIRSAPRVRRAGW